MSLRGAHLHFDCASGAAGDMALGALFQLGVPVDVVRDAIAKLGLNPACLRVETVVKRGITAVDVKVILEDAYKGEHEHEHTHEHEHEHEHTHEHEHEHTHEHEHAHEHEHEHEHEHTHEHAHTHTRYADIRRRIEHADLAAGAASRALDMFARVARAEAKIHGTTIEDVAFHEVGAIDSIVDIVGTAAALAWLRPCSVSATAVAMGHGTFTCAHGVLPVPAPAALEIMTEAAGLMQDGGVASELCTPTGAAILASSVTAWTPMPSVKPVAVGYGAGDSDLPDRANVLRVIAGERVQQAATDDLFRVEANIDDMTAELCEHAAAALFEAGAVDVWWTPITMKRSRPALQLSALTAEASLDAVLGVVLRETTSIGVRFDRVSRRVLTRKHVVVTTPFGELPIKIGMLGDEIVNAAPEYETCRQAAVDHAVPLKQVFAAAVAAYYRSTELRSQR